jgi:hypothetical protein
VHIGDSDLPPEAYAENVPDGLPMSAVADMMKGKPARSALSA